MNLIEKKINFFLYRYSLKELKDGWYVFTIANAKTSDAGSYSCTATNSLGQASCVGKLTLFRRLFLTFCSF
jgi:hypothetical protein